MMHSKSSQEFTASPTHSRSLESLHSKPLTDASVSTPDTSKHFTPPVLSTPTAAKMPDHAPKCIIPKHQDTGITIQTDILSPTSTESKTPFTPADDSDDTGFGYERMRWRLAAAYFGYFMCGWGDGVTGTVLPYFVTEFNISFMMSSLLYAGSTLGFMFGTGVVERISIYLGTFNLLDERWVWYPLLPAPFRSKKINTGVSPSRGRLLTLAISGVLHGMFFVMMGTRGGFPVLFAAYAVAAFARCLLTTPLNAYFATVNPSSIGYAFALWSLGGVGAPLVCQALMAAGVPWFKFYFGSLVLSAFNVAFLSVTFRPTIAEFGRDRDMALLAKKLATPLMLSSPVDEKCSPAPSIAASPKSDHTLRLALSLPYQWAVCIFTLLYCGCETVTQSLMAAYLLGARNANPKTAGYVTSGFWGGITIGRLVWGYYTPRLSYVQRRWVAEACLVIALVMHLLIWFVNATVPNALSTAVIGVMYGPLFPACLALANDILPLEVRFISMALISAAGSLGAAILPFAAGTISSAYSIRYVPYLNVPLAAVISILWLLFPAQKPVRAK